MLSTNIGITPAQRNSCAIYRPLCDLPAKTRVSLESDMGGVYRLFV